MYKDAIKEHAYQCAMNNLEDDYVPLDEFTAEQEKVEVRSMIGQPQSAEFITYGCTLLHIGAGPQTQSVRAGDPNIQYWRSGRGPVVPQSST